MSPVRNRRCCQMATKDKTFPLRQAREVADELVHFLGPFCEHIEVAGSIRRDKALVGDIELVAIPKFRDEPRPVTDLFEPSPPPTRVDELENFLKASILAGRLEKRGGFGPLAKYLTHVESGIPVDVFTASKENWGITFLVRTGPANYCKWVMSRFQSLGHKGQVQGPVITNVGTQSQEDVDCPTEGRVFELLEYEFVNPQARW